MPKPKTIALSESIQQFSKDRLILLVLVREVYGFLQPSQDLLKDLHPTYLQELLSAIWTDRGVWQCEP